MKHEEIIEEMSPQDIEMIAAIIGRYVKNNEAEFRAWKQEIEKKRQAHREGAIKHSNTRRYVMNMPSKLHSMIRMYRSDYDEGKNLQRFLKEFPGFRVSAKS